MLQAHSSFEVQSRIQAVEAPVFGELIRSYNSRVSELLLPTKLFIPPQRPLLVPRPRLLQQLNQGRDHKLTLVAAPAGFGKTTLVTTWITQSSAANDRQPAAWLSLDENDNLFPRFFSYFIAAMQTVFPELAQGLLSSLRMTPPPDDGAILPALLHELIALEQPLLVVLDDYHVISNEAIHEALSKLIDYMPPNLRLVITSRAEPTLPLPRWRVRGQLTEIRVPELRFTIDEAAAFLQQTMGLQLDESAIAALEKRTEGWVAGLQLAALSLRGASDPQRFIADFGGSNRQVVDYLLEEVLNYQSPEVQAFLLQTSVLERFSAELCDSITEIEDQGLDNGQVTILSTDARSHSLPILEHLENANLFLIPLDEHRRWYRYHHLFAQLLQDRLLRGRGQAKVNELHRRASGWFADQGLSEEAIDHALQGQEFDEAARLLATIPTDTLWDQGSISLFKQWGLLIPAESLRRHPRSLISIAAAHLVTGDVHQFKNFLALCEGIDSIYGEYALLKCTLVRNEGDFGRALHLAQEAGEFLPEDETTLHVVALVQIANNLMRLGDLDLAERTVVQGRNLLLMAGEVNPNMHLQVIQMQGAVARMRADNYQAMRFYREGLALAERSTVGTPPMVGMMYTGLGELNYEWNELTESADAFAQARNWAERTGISDILVSTVIGEIELLCQQGDAVAVEPYLETLRNFARQGNLPDMIVQIGSIIAVFYLRLGKLAESVGWADVSGFKLTDRPDNTQRFYYQILVAVRLAECRAIGTKDDLSDMMALLDYLLQQAQTSHYQLDIIEILILQALVLDYMEDRTAARHVLQQALELAQPGNLVRTFLDSDPALAPLLAQIDGPYAGRLYQAFRKELQSRADAVVVAPLNLTPREYEVLQEIIAGLSNKQIEEKLVISRNTVRTHIKNLYSKLEVSSRTQAIKKAHDLNLT